MATDVKTASLGNDWNDHEKLEINPKDVLDVISDSDSLNLSDLARSAFASAENVAIEGKDSPGECQELGFGRETIPCINNPEDLSKGIINTNKNKSNEYTILLIGEAGTGKTSLLSLLFNVLAGRSPEEYDLAHDENNEAGGVKSQSQTNLAKLYEFTSTNGVIVRILDTPGLADTRGLAQDELHKASIANAIKENIAFVNAVLILANGTVERLGVATDYALSTLSSMFPRTLAANIGILFTNVPNRLAWNFDQSSLPRVLGGWERCSKRGMRKNQFLLDNPVALWKKLVELRKQEWADDWTLDDFERIVNKDHKKALQELRSLFDWLDILVPQPTQEIIDLFEKYQEIEWQITNVLARAAQLRDMKAEYKALKKSTADSRLTAALFAKKKVWEQIKSKTYNQMCDHPGCYSNCDSCSRFPIFLRIQLFFQHFQGFFVPYRPCRVCKHSYEDHCIRNLRWEERDYIPEGEGTEGLKEGDDNRQANFDKVIASLDKDMKEALISLGRLTESYSTSSLLESIPGHIKKSIRLLEMHLKAAQQHSEADIKSIEAIKKGLENMKRKLKIVEAARKKKAVTNVGQMVKWNPARKYTRSFNSLWTGPDNSTNDNTPPSISISLGHLMYNGS